MAQEAWGENADLHAREPQEESSRVRELIGDSVSAARRIANANAML